MRIRHENKIFKFTFLFYMFLALILFLLESFVNENIWWNLWHMLSNIVNFLVLATTIFLITLNNPIMVEQGKHKIKTLVYYVFQIGAILLTVISPLTIINSQTQQYLIQLWDGFWKHQIKLNFYYNWVELIFVIFFIFIFSILFFNAKIFSTQHKHDDQLIDKKIMNWILKYENKKK